ncbi:MAG: hypothetical protein R2939_10005 [Kofleriaceae bacterium]
MRGPGAGDLLFALTVMAAACGSPGAGLPDARGVGDGGGSPDATPPPSTPAQDVLGTDWMVAGAAGGDGTGTVVDDGSGTLVITIGGVTATCTVAQNQLTCQIGGTTYVGQYACNPDTGAQAIVWPPEAMLGTWTRDGTCGVGWEEVGYACDAQVIAVECPPTIEGSSTETPEPGPWTMTLEGAAYDFSPPPPMLMYANTMHYTFGCAVDGDGTRVWNATWREQCWNPSPGGGGFLVPDYGNAAFGGAAGRCPPVGTYTFTMWDDPNGDGGTCSVVNSPTATMVRLP